MINPGVYAAVAEGLVSSGLYSLFGQVYTTAGKSLKGDLDSSIRRSISDSDFASIVGVGPLADGSAEEFKLFLASPEAQTIVRQIYSFRLTESKNGGLDSIRSAFLKLMIASVPGVDESLARKVFKLILGACEAALDKAVEAGSVIGLEAKQSSRHRVLVDQLAAIASNLQLLSSKPDIGEILSFEETYRDQVAVRHDSIQPPHLDRQKKYPIDSLYVAPNVTRYLRESDRTPYPRPIPIRQLLSRIHRAVLLGNPGAGKSTFAQKVCHDLSTSETFGGRRVTPILVVLRDYGAQKKEHTCSILQFIESRCPGLYQITPPPKSFEYLMLNGRAVVIFDGLDELLETGYRREIGDDIESFCNLYPSTPMIVTSRMVGYEQAPLDHRKFDSYRLADFDEGQVSEYAFKWFRTDDSSSPEHQAKRAEAFLNESRSVPDIRSNPVVPPAKLDTWGRV